MKKKITKQTSMAMLFIMILFPEMQKYHETETRKNMFISENPDVNDEDSFASKLFPKSLSGASRQRLKYRLPSNQLLKERKSCLLQMFRSVIGERP